jgi:hypothetical protein
MPETFWSAVSANRRRPQRGRLCEVIGGGSEPQPPVRTSSLPTPITSLRRGYAAQPVRRWENDRHERSADARVSKNDSVEICVNLWINERSLVTIEIAQ